MAGAVTNFTIYQGQDVEFTVTVTANDTGALVDLTGATIECQVKAETGAADPAALALAVGSGITIPTQTGSNFGKCTIAMTSANTAALSARDYYYDVVVVQGGSRQYVIPPSRLTVKAVVNQA